MIQVTEYLDLLGRSPFADWFDSLDPQAAAKVAVALMRMDRGALSSLKGLGAGLLEYRLDFGPGYRIYLAREGEQLIILLAGGTKKRQDHDIAAARARLTDYKRRKAGG
jgi:putative addiction module killer protein